MDAAERLIPYSPRRAFVPYHIRQERWACLVAHRRAGKTVATVNDLLARNLANKRPRPVSAYIAPFMRQARQAAWDYLKFYAAPALADQPNETRLAVNLINGGTIQLFGGDNPDALRGMYLDDVVLDEFADMRPGLWTSVVLPALGDRDGAATFIGTPKGHNEFHKVWERAQTDEQWFALMLKASETGLLPAEFLAEAAKSMTTDEYDREFECSFEAAIRGAYYGGEMRAALESGRIGFHPHNPALPVDTAWDIGTHDSTAIWFAQFIGQELRIIDYHEDRGQGVDHYARVLQNKPYSRGRCWVPHDAKVLEWGGGKTRVESMISLGLKPELVPNVSIEDGINAVRLTLPRCTFNASTCEEGVEALRQYRVDEDSKMLDPRTNAPLLKGRPLHDWTSHAADAFRYLCLAYRQEAGLVKPRIENAGTVTLPGIPKAQRRRRI